MGNVKPLNRYQYMIEEEMIVLSANVEDTKGPIKLTAKWTTAYKRKIH